MDTWTEADERLHPRSGRTGRFIEKGSVDPLVQRLADAAGKKATKKAAPKKRAAKKAAPKKIAKKSTKSPVKKVAAPAPTKKANVETGATSGAASFTVGDLLKPANYGKAEKLLREFFEVEYPSGASVKVSKVTHFGEDVQVSGEVLHGGKSVGKFDRIVGRDSSGNLYAEHMHLELAPEFRGQGFAKQFNNRLIDWYNQSGVQRVILFADIDVGGYAWARAGYDFKDDESANNVLDRLGDKLRAFKRDADFFESPDEAREYKAIVAAAQELIDRRPPPTPFEISELGRGMLTDYFQNDWLGRSVMLGSNWNGVKWLGNSSQG